VAFTPEATCLQAKNKYMKMLFSPLTIKSITFKNRIVVSPMCQYSSVDGFASDWHLVHLGSRAIGGAALIIQEATAVTAAGRITYGDMGIWKDEHIEKLKSINSFIKEHGAVTGIQLAHAGRKASCEKPWIADRQIAEGEHHWQTVSASPIPFREGDMLPHALTQVEIKELVNDFKAATVRSVAAGFEVLEIHAAHGYLIHQFLSPLTNKRMDEYGGSFDNRIRFLMEILGAVQEVWPAALPLFVRISATDWVEGGWTIDDSVILSSLLKKHQVDLVDASSGGAVTGVKIPVAPGYQVPLAAAIKNQSGILTGAVGLITEAEQAETILEQQAADLIFIARSFLQDPYFALHAARKLEVDIDWPVQYARAKK
jgi:2,4-dienoyl-CoA reductase-like NADH-dependent reductase (Old Yellow Enzyme family)